MSNSFNMFGPQKKLKRKKNLVEFRAGKMKLDKNNWVYPDKRKGLVFIHQTPDGKIHFCWKDRISDLVEDDLIVFPQETEFKRLPECTTGRVYLLKFKNTNKLFLWMQEPREDKDAEFCRLVNEVLNKNRSEAGSNGQRDLNMAEFTNLLGQLNDIGALNEIDLMEILGLTQGYESHVTAETDVTNAYGLNTNPFQIRSNISSITIPEGNSHVVEPKINQPSNIASTSDKDFIVPISVTQPTVVIDPNFVFTENTLTQLAENNAFRTQLLSLDNSLPHEAIDTTSDEFRAAVRNFGVILNDGQTGRALLTDMGLPENIINKTLENDIVSLINDLEEYYQSKNKGT